MKKILALVLFIVITFCLLNSCRKDENDEQYTPIDTHIIPDFTPKVIATVSGFITDENNNAVEGAFVTAGTASATTDKFGYFTIGNASFSKAAAFIQVSMSGYFNGYRTFVANEGKESFIRLKLIPKKTIGTINATTGGAITTTEGASVTLPADAVVTASNNVAYSGVINVAAHWIDPSSDDLPLNMPGNLCGIDTAGYLNALITYGMLAVELTDQNGNLLQIANGKLATISFPIPQELASIAPASIPLWSFNVTNGLWLQESQATKTGNNYTGQVNHFSYWNCDIGLPLVYFKAQVVDESLHPLINVPVSLAVNGSPYTARTAYTDTAGYVYGMIPGNSNIILSILNACGSPVFAKTFTAGNTSIDAGTITANISSNQSTITGFAVDCNNNRIINGIVYLIDSNNTSKKVAINANNGSFSFDMLYCANKNISIFINDLTNNYVSEVQKITVTPGNNDLGTLTVCNPVLNLSKYIDFTVQGQTPIVYTDITSSGIYNSIIDSTSIVIGSPSTGGILNVSFKTGGTGSKQAVNGTFWYNGYAYTPTPSSFPITITEFGAAGTGNISGNFSNVTFHNGIAGDIVISSCSFKVPRDQ
ncbi:carboxypeptidase-like regulatory domain-containing protein [Ferruginibacter albus]|uniref:carboxypeptidase-like regulatory domain-containing protein n=1 Tax=Ferruginibacter albus TaxID=2875540 RepID=UPI001CC7026B|nr:carboxypeptidase-like regulatory domain-containing protein [Ferruginibacter albus]UAY51445.1 carboxypeptidase-like regulatory domain-containing protein [Ferruginibacter albus]